MDIPGSGLASPEIFLNGQAAQTEAMTDKGNGEETGSTGSQPKPKSKWRKFRAREHSSSSKKSRNLWCHHIRCVLICRLISLAVPRTAIFLRWGWHVTADITTYPAWFRSLLPPRQTYFSLELLCSPALKYSVLVAEHPFLVFGSTLLLIVICGIFDFVPQLGAPEVPDFKRPVIGFEARGSVINQRWRTRFSLNKEFSNGKYKVYPDLASSAIKDTNISFIESNKTNSSHPGKHKRFRRSFTTQGPGNWTLSNHPIRMCDSPNVYMQGGVDLKMVFSSIRHDKNLMNAESLKAVCRIEDKVLRSFPDFENRCFRRNVSHGNITYTECCPSWTLGNYIAEATKKRSCQAIEKKDVDFISNIIKGCASFYHKGKIKENCWDFKHQKALPFCSHLPLQCVRSNAVYNILHYLTDKGFFGKTGNEGNQVLLYTAVLTPRTFEEDWQVAVYEKHLKNGDITDGDVKLVGTDFNYLKFIMFNKMLKADLVYPTIAMCAVLIIMWFYTESIILTILLVVSVVSALIIAYFLYMIVLGLKFFPFLNVTTLIFLVGIGADDAFVYTDVWRQSKKLHPSTGLTKITAETLRHASLSMFVTSFTTAAAFLANLSSEITSIRCFGLYAGTAILCKFTLMVTWFPAAVVINEKWCEQRSCRKDKNCKKASNRAKQILNEIPSILLGDAGSVERDSKYGSNESSDEDLVRGEVTDISMVVNYSEAEFEKRKETESSMTDTLSEINLSMRENTDVSGVEFYSDTNRLSKGCVGAIRYHYNRTISVWARYCFDKFFPEIIHRLRFFWVALFFGMTVYGLVVLLYKPGLQLPTSTDFQMFASSHPLEAYDLYLKDKFRFESSTSQDGVTFNIDIYWGIQPFDTGDWLNPYDFGELQWDKSFDIAHPDSQRWLLKLCRKLREQDFYAKKSGIEERCFIETFYNQSCDMDPSTRIVRYPCCKNRTSLFDKRTLGICSTIAANQRSALRYQKVDSSIGEIIYEGKEIKGLAMHITSTIPLSRAYKPAEKFWNKIETWVESEMKGAPPGMRNGWFISQLEFYDLQRSLSDGTITSMGISVLTAFVVMLLTTMNIFVSIYAITSIIGILSVTIGALVLSGWKLNILESITMSVAVGLSIDLVMHFGVAYCLATDKNCRKTRVAFSLSRMGSAITMAAITTFIAGALMMPSHVLSYIQLGHFLMLVMSVSWAFSTFFFQSLCSIAGPQGNFGQLSSYRLCKKKSSGHVSEELKPLHSSENLTNNHETSRAEESKVTDIKILSDVKKTSQEYLSDTEDVHEEESRSVETRNLTNSHPDRNRKDNCKTLAFDIGDRERNILLGKGENTSDTTLLREKDEHDDKALPGEVKTEDVGKLQEVDNNESCNDTVTSSIPLLFESPV